MGKQFVVVVEGRFVVVGEGPYWRQVVLGADDEGSRLRLSCQRGLHVGQKVIRKWVVGLDYLADGEELMDGWRLGRHLVQ
jgi:hypothetical protein